MSPSSTSGRSTRPLFTNTPDGSGYDGLGIEAYGHGLALSRDAGAYAYAQAEETPKTTWLIVSDTAEAPAGGEDHARLRLQGQPVRRLGRPQGHRRARLLRRGAAAAAGRRQQERQPARRARTNWAGSAPTPRPSRRRPGTWPRSARRCCGTRRTSPAPMSASACSPATSGGCRPTAPGQGLQLGQGLLGYSLPDPRTASRSTSSGPPRGTSPTPASRSAKTPRPSSPTRRAHPCPRRTAAASGRSPSAPLRPWCAACRRLPLSLDAPAAAAREARRLLALADSEKVNVEQLSETFFHLDNTTHDTPAGRRDPLRRLRAGHRRPDPGPAPLHLDRGRGARPNTRSTR